MVTIDRMLKCPIEAVLLLVIVFISSCTHPYEQEAQEALLLAEDNRAELEKVIAHYQDDPDPLKRKSAWFLIANMPYHGGLEGKDVEAYDSAYIKTAEECPERRDSTFKAEVGKIGFGFFDSKADILTMKADYLIKAIDNACEAWHASTWSKDYDEAYFFNYVLPYRILDEPLSDWRSYLDSAMPELRSNSVRSNRGVEMEAENAGAIPSLLTEATSASQGRMVMLNGADDAVTFKIETPLSARKNIILRYVSAEKDACLGVVLNGKKLTDLALEPTKNMGIFRETRRGFDINLQKGLNTLTITHAKGAVGLDKIRMRAIEPYEKEAIPDFSDSYCLISNKATGEYISFDTLRTSLLKPVELRPRSSKDCTQLLRLNYLGYPCWNICSFSKDSTDLCMEVQYCLTDTAALMAQYHYQGGNHQKWVIMPVENGNGYYRIMNKNSGLFLEARRNSMSGKDTLVQMPYSAKDSQHWRIEKAGRNPIKETFFRPGSAISEALRVTDMMSLFEFLNYSGNIPPKATSLLRGLTGKCRDEADYTVYLCRHLGIPSTVDFTPHWGNRSLSHS